ncbi:MAG: methyltransferase domain-containing protein [Acidimicrobiales bacterium]
MSEQERGRYRFMAETALRLEREQWEAAGIVEGATVADIGCGPGAVSAVLAGLVGGTGRVLAVDGDPEAVAAARLRPVPSAIRSTRAVGATASPLTGSGRQAGAGSIVAVGRPPASPPPASSGRRRRHQPPRRTTSPVGRRPRASEAEGASPPSGWPMATAPMGR